MAPPQNHDFNFCLYLKKAHLPNSHTFAHLLNHTEAGCSQEEGPKKGFVMGSRTRGVQEILEKCM